MNRSTFEQAAKLFEQKKEWEQARDFFKISDFQKNDSLSNKTEADLTEERVVTFLTNARNVSSQSVKNKLAKHMLKCAEDFIKDEIKRIETSIDTL